jgi:hypothetical protein
MAVKRRIIWMSDEEWAMLKQIGEDRGQTVSGVIRNFREVASNPAKYEPLFPIMGLDASDARIAAAGFNTRPFRPSPKKGK